jgi:hypothetical protein
MYVQHAVGLTSVYPLDRAASSLLRLALRLLRMSFVRIDALQYNRESARKQRLVSESHAPTQREASCLDTQVDGIAKRALCAICAVVTRKLAMDDFGSETTIILW